MQLSVNNGGLIRSSFDRAASGQLGSPQTTMKTIWIWTKNKDLITTLVENHLTTFIFTSDTKHLVEDWTCFSTPNPHSFPVICMFWVCLWVLVCMKGWFGCSNCPDQAIVFGWWTVFGFGKQAGYRFWPSVFLQASRCSASFYISGWGRCD